MGALSELAEATREVADQVGPSVVRIGRQGGRGCGVIVAENSGDSDIGSLPAVMLLNIGTKWPKRRPGKD